MKIIFSVLFLTSLTQATIPSLANHKKNDKDSFLTTTLQPHQEWEIHRQLRSSCNFECPAHAARKRGKSCECECDEGYTMSADGTCQAPSGLCSEAYAESVSDMVDEVNSYVNLVYRATDPDERYGYYEQMEIVLNDTWDAYNRGKASCEVELGDNFMDEDFDGPGRKLLLRERQLFFRRIGRAFRRVGNFIKNTATAVVRAVVATVETVVNVVLELIECGVGIATDGLKCGLIGCAFGLVGVALDIAFTLATGGLSKASAAACSISGAVTFDDKQDEESAKQEKASTLSPILLGIGAAVCTINEKLEDRTLATVCELKEKAESIDSGLAVAELIVIDPISFKFLETFRNAMCGNPGSAVLDLLEEVVSCSIGCAQDDNVFCPVNDDDEKEEDSDNKAPAAAPRQPEEGNEPKPGKIDPIVDIEEFEEFKGQACRNSKGNKGKDGEEFELIRDISEEECETRCSESSACKGYEYNYADERCEIWTTEPARFEEAPEFICFVKLD